MKIQFSCVEGNSQKLDGGAMFGNAPREVWKRWAEPDEKGRIQLATRGFLLQTGERKILFEAGIGNFFEPKLADRYGIQDSKTHKLIESLGGLGVSPEDVTDVVLSHLHFDHAGGLLSSHREGGGHSLVFPNARYIVSQGAWERALNPHPRDRASFVLELNQLLRDSGRLQVIDPKRPPEDLAEIGIQFIETHGHTPGQMLSMINCKQACIVFLGDLVPGAPWLHVPITMGYDRYPELLIDEKSYLYGDLARLKKPIWLAFEHDLDHPIVRVEFEQIGEQWKPLVVETRQSVEFEVMP